MIDLRSDTVTRPTAGMRDAMFSAAVGDDVYSDDPSVNALEDTISKLFGYEAAVFCPSGTMTNQIAIKTHTIPGDEVICDASSHIYNYEGGGMAFNSGVQVRAINGVEGRITAEEIVENIHPPIINLPRTSLVGLENTLNKAGGSYYTLAQISKISNVCKEHHLPLHLDGARIFNALLATGDAAKDYSKYFNSISVCFSKGLGAPMGSALLGSTEFIAKARRYRRLLGGGMRQAGIMAAAASYALEFHVDRLQEDHDRAQEIAKCLEHCSYISKLFPVYTNIIIFKLPAEIPAEKLLTHLRNNDIIANTMGKQTVRFVTHLDITDDAVTKICAALKSFQA